MPWGFSDRKYRVKISVKASKIDADLSGYVVYFNPADLVQDTFWDNVKSDAGDLIFSESDETTRLPVEIVSFDTSGKTGEIYFRSNSISSSLNTEFYVYWGNPTATQPGVSETYGRNAVWSDYEVVAHFEHSGSTSPVDSTGNNTGTLQGTSSYVTGDFGTAVSTPGSKNGRVEFGTFDLSSFSEFSQMIWGKLTGTFTYGRYLSTEYTGGDDFRIIYQDPTLDVDTLRFGMDDGSSTPILWTGSFDNTRRNSWGLYVLRSTGSTTQAIVDDTSIASQSETTDFSGADINSGLAVGAQYGFTAQDRTNATIADEVRMADDSFSQAYFYATYRNYDDSSSFYDLGSVETAIQKLPATVIWWN